PSGTAVLDKSAGVQMGSGRLLEESVNGGEEGTAEIEAFRRRRGQRRRRRRRRHQLPRALGGARNQNRWGVRTQAADASHQHNPTASFHGSGAAPLRGVSPAVGLADGGPAPSEQAAKHTDWIRDSGVGSRWAQE